jgi:hypothetical protein
VKIGSLFSAGLFSSLWGAAPPATLGSSSWSRAHLVSFGRAAELISAGDCGRVGLQVGAATRVYVRGVKIQYLSVGVRLDSFGFYYFHCPVGQFRAHKMHVLRNVVIYALATGNFLS